MRESSVEKILVDGIDALGGVAFKFVSPGNNGVPDRLIVLPKGRIYFVELKRDDGKASAPQRAQLRRLKNLGANAMVLYGESEVREFLKRVREVMRDDIQPTRVSADGIRLDYQKS